MALSQDAFKVTDYMTMLPRLDLMMQWAWYDKSSQLLNYRFGLVKGGLAFGFPDNWSIGTAVDYNTLSNLHTGEKSFDSVSPSVSLQKSFPPRKPPSSCSTPWSAGPTWTPLSPSRLPESFRTVPIIIKIHFPSLI